jgi:predicted glycoside hydrolase/deacetylase ChbG (UPF0249 family)
MPNGAAFEDAVRVASETPGLGVGVHLSLVDEYCIAPIERVRSLVDADGLLPPSYAAFVKGYVLRRFGAGQIRAEVEAQVARVIEAGIKPTHIDSHQHLHILPGVFDIVLAAAKSAGIGRIRIPLERGGVGACVGISRKLQLRVLGVLCRLCASKARRAGMSFPDHFWGLGVSGDMNEANLIATLRRLRPGLNEIMCHPGFSDPATSARYDWGYHWDDEAAALVSEKVGRVAEEEGITLIARD